MAVSLHHGRAQAGARRRVYRPMSEINVTPFVDVMLVLLIIFMVTAPLLTVGVPVNLPKTSANTISRPDKPIIISINAGGKVFIQETEIKLDELVPKLQAITSAKPGTRIYLRGDRAVNYGRIMQVMGTVSAAGFNKVALIAEMSEIGGGGSAKDVKKGSGKAGTVNKPTR